MFVIAFPIPRSGPVQLVSRAMFGLAGVVLMVLAVGLILQGLYYPIIAFMEPSGQGKTALLGAVGYVVIAIALFDVTKFLIEEEVVIERTKQTAVESRHSLTKFISTILIAVFLEALVTVFPPQHRAG